MPESRDRQIADHNRMQKDYFEGTFKKTMVPRDTPYLSRQIDELVKFGNLGSDDRILEIGCGMGRYTLILAARGYRVEGLDMTPGLLEQLHAYDGGRYRVPTHCFDILDRPAEMRERFDAVVALFTLHHVHDLDLCISAMRHYVRPGGRFVFLEPNPLNPLYYVQILITPRMRWRAEKGMLDMGPARMAAAAARAGLGEIRFRRFGLFPPQIVNRSIGSRIERVLEKLPGIGPFLAFNLVEMRVPESS